MKNAENLAKKMSPYNQFMKVSSLSKWTHQLALKRSIVLD